MKMKLHEFTSKDDAFLITSPTYKTMMQSTLPPFLKLMHGLGNHNKKDDVFETTWGSKIYLRTETDPDSIVGITNIRHIWGDEAGKYRLYFWENMQARADFCGATIDLTTSPYSLNWVYKELIKGYLAGKRPDVKYIKAASWENPYHSLFDPIKRREKRETMDPRRFDMIYGGEFGKMVGLVYDCWDEDANICKPFPLPPGTKFYGGVDWGYTDPFVLVVRAITPTGEHYQVSEFCRTNQTIGDIIKYAKQMKQVWGITSFFCDPSQPGYIAEFNRHGLPATAADNDIRRGIDLHYELIKSRKYKLFEGTSAHTIDEMETYHYPEPKDLGPDDNSKELVPVDQSNHCADANRYCTISTYHSNLSHKVFVPGETRPDETAERRLARLKKRSNQESYS